MSEQREITVQLIHEIRVQIGRKDTAKLQDLIDDLHVADIAEILEELSTTDAQFLYQFIAEEKSAEILVELDDDLREDLLADLTAKEIAEEVITEGGIVLLDDLLNHLWIEVVSAYSDYKLKGGKLIAFAVTKDKLYLTSSREYAKEYQSVLQTAFGSKLNFLIKELFGDRVLTYYPRLLKNAIDSGNIKLFFKKPIISLRFFFSVIKRTTKEEKW